LLAIGIDIGGTKILGALVDDAGNVSHELRVPSPAQDPDKMVEVVAGLINQLLDLADQPVIGAGVAAAGFIDAQQSTILYAPNLNWRNEPLRDRIASQVSCPVIIENDANAAGWAEFKFGAGREFTDMVMLTLGTGVGGAVIASGQLLRGGFGIAGELGHITVVDDGRLCGCGRRGCIEQYGSGTAVLRAARKLAESDGPAGTRLRELAVNTGELTGLGVYQALLEGDVGAQQVVDEAGSYLGRAMASLTAVLDPQVFVIGGGLSEAGEKILGPIRESFSKSIPARGFRPEAQVLAAHFSNQAGVIGAADLARVTLG
jgi:glucokinase